MLTYKSKREMLPFKCGLCSLVDTKGHCRQLGWSFLQEHQAGPLELSSGEATHCESCLHLTHMLPFCNACCRSFVFSTNMALLLSTHRTPAHTMLPDYPFQLISAVSTASALSSLPFPPPAIAAHQCSLAASLIHPHRALRCNKIRLWQSKSHKSRLLINNYGLAQHLP